MKVVITFDTLRCYFMFVVIVKFMVFYFVIHFNRITIKIIEIPMQFLIITFILPYISLFYLNLPLPQHIFTYLTLPCLTSPYISLFYLTLPLPQHILTYPFHQF